MTSGNGARPLLRARGLVRGFGAGAARIPVLRGLDFDAAAGEMVAIVGRSGVGKTTLLQVLGLLDRPEAGELDFAGEDAAALPERAAAAFRNRRVGFVFQHHRLLPELTAVENASLPLRIRREPRKRAESRAGALLADLGLGDRLHHRSEELSGGEQQRVAVARALAAEPSLLLADEPTGNLDDDSSTLLMDLLVRLHRARGLTSVIATHSGAVAGRCGRVLRLEGGVLRPAGDGGPGPLLPGGESPGSARRREAPTGEGCGEGVAPSPRKTAGGIAQRFAPPPRGKSAPPRDPTGTSQPPVDGRRAGRFSHGLLNSGAATQS